MVKLHAEDGLECQPTTLRIVLQTSIDIVREREKQILPPNRWQLKTEVKRVKAAMQLKCIRLYGNYCTINNFSQFITVFLNSWCCFSTDMFHWEDIQIPNGLCFSSQLLCKDIRDIAFASANWLPTLHLTLELSRFYLNTLLNKLQNEKYFVWFLVTRWCASENSWNIAPCTFYME